MSPSNISYWSEASEVKKWGEELETIDFNKNLRVYTIVIHWLKNLTQDFGKMELKLFEAINFF